MGQHQRVLPTQPDMNSLVERAAALAARRRAGKRALLGIAGPPGAGKSTLADALVERLDARDPGSVALVGLDGYHLAGSALEALGTAADKGAPHTFDAMGYLALLARLRSEPGTVWAPQFRREIEEPVAGAVRVGPHVALVVTEGNYLLLRESPWAATEALLDETWLLTSGDADRRARLSARHRQYGRTTAAAWDRTVGSDEANAVLVASRSRAPDLRVALTTPA